MAKHLNRLTKKDAINFDKAFKQFCKTRVWNMTEENLTEEKITEEEFDKAFKLSIKPRTAPTHIGLEKRGFMADPNRTGRFPGSRDWDLESKIPCANKKCMCYTQSFGKGTCGVPSLMAIDSHGKCSGYKPKPKPKTKRKK